MNNHNYTLHRIVEDSPYFWVIFCTQCGHVSYYGNWCTADWQKVQSNLPGECVESTDEVITSPTFAAIAHRESVQGEEE